MAKGMTDWSYKHVAWVYGHDAAVLTTAPRSPKSPVIDGKTPADYKQPAGGGNPRRRWIFVTQPTSLDRFRSAFMANTSSAKKAARKIARRTEVNKARRSRMRSTLRAVDEAIASGDRNKALEAMKNAEPALMRAARQGQVHRNTASRKVSRLTHQIAKLGK